MSFLKQYVSFNLLTITAIILFRDANALLGQIPIVQSFRENGDAGEPAALSSRPDGLAFLNLAEKLVKSVEMP